MLAYIILGFLMCRSMTGYDIKQFMSVSTANFIDASYGSIYPALKKLEKQGYITAEEQIERGKLKKVYTIQPVGKEAFLEWLCQPIEPSVTKLSFLGKIFFYKHLESKQAHELLLAFKAYIIELIDNLENTEELVANHAEYYEISTLHFGRGYYQYLLQWCQTLIDNLEKNNV